MSWFSVLTPMEKLGLLYLAWQAFTPRGSPGSPEAHEAVHDRATPAGAPPRRPRAPAPVQVRARVTRPPAQQPSPRARPDASPPPVAPRSSTTAAPAPALRPAQLVVKLPVRLSGVERMFASASAVTGPLEGGIAPAVERVRARVPHALEKTGAAHVTAAEADYGYLATVVVPVRFDAARRAELERVVREVITSDAHVRDRVTPSAVTVHFT